MKSRVLAISKTGTAHLVADVEQDFSPCQDACKVAKFPGSEVPMWNGKLKGMILAVADGHGNPIYHGSSEIGSKLAVEAAVECMLTLLTEYEEKQESEIFYKFPVMVTKAWRQHVWDHARRRFPETNLRRRFSDETSFEDYMERIYVDYGSTLLAAVAIPEKKLLVTAQLGDGDIFLMYRGDPKRDIHRLAGKNLRREFGSNMTDSLCMYHAAKKFDMEILDGETYPADAEILKDYVLLLATDGISSGAKSEFHYLYGYCRPYMEDYMYAEQSESCQLVHEYIQDEMEKELCKTSYDDMTLVLMAVNDREKEEV